jgi:hypothetical protein
MAACRPRLLASPVAFASSDGAVLAVGNSALSAELAEHLLQRGRDLLALLEHRRVRHDLDRAALDPGVGPDLLQLADERTGIDPGVALGDDDVVGGDLAGADRRGGLRRLELLVQPERVVVGAEQTDVARDELGEGLDALVDLLQRADQQRVAAHPQVGGAVQLRPHVL